MIPERMDQLLKTNPFSTHRVRPGCLPFRFPAGQNLAEVLDVLQENNWRGQIVGPHGTGKTTLLRTLDDHWVPIGRTPITVTLRNRHQKLPDIAWHSCDQQTQLVVDGYEQLSWLGRRWLNMRCSLSKCGLLITTHTVAAGFPVALKTKATADLVHHLARELTDVRLSQECIEGCFGSANGNVREAFMLLYDAFEDASVYDNAMKNAT